MNYSMSTSMYNQLISYTFIIPISCIHGSGVLMVSLRESLNHFCMIVLPTLKSIPKPLPGMLDYITS